MSQVGGSQASWVDRRKLPGPTKLRSAAPLRQPVGCAPQGAHRDDAGAGAHGADVEHEHLVLGQLGHLEGVERRRGMEMGEWRASRMEV